MLSINFWNILWTVVNLLVLYVVFRKVSLSESHECD